MRIWTHRYELLPGPDPSRAARCPRQGALIKIQFDDAATGYADIHPWTEFGHAPLAEHLASFSIAHPTQLASLAIRHARTDAAARRAGVSLFDGLPPVRSHALFTDWSGAPRTAFEQCVAEGYSAAKLKISQNPEREADAVNRLAGLPLHWRLDANASAATKVFLIAIHPNVREKIEFLEDPSSYEPSAWSALSEDMKIPLALDWQLPPSPPPWPGANILVIKPAAQDTFPLALAAAHAGMEIVITHSMDHPLGQAVALWTAMRLRQRHGDLVRDGGLQAAGLYQPDAFTAQFAYHGPLTTPPPGTGFGFDDQLARTHWTPLS